MTELRTNGSSINTDIGGGDHSYLSLILTDVKYAYVILIPTLFVASIFPGVLTIEPAATAI